MGTHSMGIMENSSVDPNIFLNDYLSQNNMMECYTAYFGENIYDI